MVLFSAHSYSTGLHWKRLSSQNCRKGLQAKVQPKRTACCFPPMQSLNPTCHLHLEDSAPSNEELFPPTVAPCLFRKRGKRMDLAAGRARVHLHRSMCAIEKKVKEQLIKSTTSHAGENTIMPLKDFLVLFLNTIICQAPWLISSPNGWCYFI